MDYCVGIYVFLKGNGSSDDDQTHCPAQYKKGRVAGVDARATSSIRGSGWGWPSRGFDVLALRNCAAARVTDANSVIKVGHS